MYNTVPNFFNLLTGWGFSCKIVLDDDENGRAAYNQVKEQWSISEADTKKKFLKLKNGPTIEGLFDPIDFQKHVIGLPESEISASFDFVSSQGRGEGKALLAKRFFEKVIKKSIKKEMFSETSVANFKEVFVFIKS